MLYQIRDWDKHFENHESRKVKAVRWVGLPNKHDGKGYRRVAASRDAVPVLAAWTLLLQVASKMPERGVLADEDGPLDSSDLSAMTGFPAEIFEKAFKLLTDKKIGWLETVDAPGTSRDLPELPAIPPESALEGKGMEGNGREDKSVVVPPTAEATGPQPLSRAKQGEEIFEYWRSELGKNGQAKFDTKRRAAVERMLRDNSVDFIKQAIRGIKQSPHNMGENDRHTVFDDIELICRSQSNLERFASYEEPRRKLVAAVARGPCLDCDDTGEVTIADPANNYEDVTKPCRCEHGSRRQSELQTS